MRQSTGDNGQKAGGEGAPGLCVFLHSIFAPEKGVDLKSNPCQNAPFYVAFFWRFWALSTPSSADSRASRSSAAMWT